MQGKCNILQNTFFSGKYFENSDFDEEFKLTLEEELHEIKSNHDYEDLYDGVVINRDITLEETEASLEYLKLGQAKLLDLTKSLQTYF